MLLVQRVPTGMEKRMLAGAETGRAATGAGWRGV
jgi:hypothetical protein